MTNNAEQSAQLAVQTKKTSVMWSSYINTEKAPLSLAVCVRQTAGPADSFALLKAAGILKTRFAQTVGVCAYLKILFRHLFRCSTNANGEVNMALEGPIR